MRAQNVKNCFFRHHHTFFHLPAKSYVCATIYHFGIDWVKFCVVVVAHDLKSILISYPCLVYVLNFMSLRIFYIFGTKWMKLPKILGVVPHFGKNFF